MKTLLFSHAFALVACAGFLLFIFNSQALACAACYGDTSGSKMGNAAAVGIFAMVVLMFAMLGAVAAFGWHLAYRAKHPLPDYEDLMNEENPNPGESV